MNVLRTRHLTLAVAGLLLALSSAVAPVAAFAINGPPKYCVQCYSTPDGGTIACAIYVCPA
jgi:hypothetical protein